MSLPHGVTSLFDLIFEAAELALFSAIVATVSLFGGLVLLHTYDYLNERLRHALPRASYQVSDARVLVSTIVVLSMLVVYIRLLANENVDRDPTCHKTQSTDIVWEAGTPNEYVNGTRDVYVCEHNFDVPDSP